MLMFSRSLFYRTSPAPSVTPAVHAGLAQAERRLTALGVTGASYDKIEKTIVDWVKSGDLKSIMS